MDYTVRKSYGVAVEFIGNAMNVLKWGAELWKDAGREERGPVFAPTYITGVHALYLEALLPASVLRFDVQVE